MKRVEPVIKFVAAFAVSFVAGFIIAKLVVALWVGSEAVKGAAWGLMLLIVGYPVYRLYKAVVGDVRLNKVSAASFKR